MTISPHAGDLRRNRVHQHRRRIRRLAARHVDADAVQRRDLLAQHRAVGRRGAASCGRRPPSSALVVAAHAPRGRFERARCWRAGLRTRPSARRASARARRRWSPPVRSKRFVYSSTASSPRVFTSARIAATERSIASSSLASNASTACSDLWKSGAVESSLRILIDIRVYPFSVRRALQRGHNMVGPPISRLSTHVRTRREWAAARRASVSARPGSRRGATRSP